MASLPSYDIVIVGAGPVGLVLATYLARWGYNIKHIDNRLEPTATGRADGIQPRSLDMLKNMGLKRQIMMHNPARVYEVAFWDPQNGGKGIHRTGTWASCPKFIDSRHPYTTLLHQGHIERVFLRDLEKNGARVDRPWTITDFETNAKDPSYPVEVEFEHVESKQKERVKAKYLFSGEGARSFVREKLQIQIRHKDPIAHVWGVMDGVVRTNFPDIKMKCTIHSDSGSIMIIPREDNMVRLYIQVASSTDEKWDPRMKATEEEVIQHAKDILKPYWIEWERVEWYSVYPIGQGIADKYTLDNRVFMGGDACHTHSPKAGQGMNTAFLDAQNLAWKIHQVEAGFLDRSVLPSYESERKSVAESLLDFDAEYAALFSERIPSAGEVGQASSTVEDQPENKFVNLFKSSCEFTSGYGVAYGPNRLNWHTDHAAKSSAFIRHDEKSALRPGRILPPANVIRVADANEVHLDEEIPTNGAWRIYLFAGRWGTTRRAVSDFASHLSKPNSFYKRFERPDINTVSYHERHLPHSRFFTLCTIFAEERKDVNIAELPETLARYNDHVYADTVPDRRAPTANAPAHAKFGLREDRGAVVVVRPDSYVGCVVELKEGNETGEALDNYFGTFTAQSAGDRGNGREARL